MSDLLAYLSRMQLIRRWGLMRSTQPENDLEHAAQTALLAQGIALVARERFGKDVNVDRVAALALYHDAAEVLTGDMPTPVKYRDDGLRAAYHAMERDARERLVRMAPEDLRGAYAGYLAPEDSYELTLVKAADRIAAYVKCLEEQTAGNREFDAARASTEKRVREIDLPEVQAFFDTFVSAFGKTLDEMAGSEGEKE